jgi:hypothetical protein
MRFSVPNPAEVIVGSDGEYILSLTIVTPNIIASYSPLRKPPCRRFYCCNKRLDSGTAEEVRFFPPAVLETTMAAAVDFSPEFSEVSWAEQIFPSIDDRDQKPDRGLYDNIRSLE